MKIELPVTNIEKFIKDHMSYTIYYPNNIVNVNKWIKEIVLLVPSNKNALMTHYHLQDNGGGWEGIRINWTNTYIK